MVNSCDAHGKGGTKTRKDGDGARVEASSVRLPQNDWELWTTVEPMLRGAFSAF